MTKEKYLEIKKEIDQKRNELITHTKELLNEQAKELFASYGVLNEFQLISYRVYFNDGNACPYIFALDSINGQNEYDCDNDVSQIWESVREATENTFFEFAEQVFGNDVCLIFKRGEKMIEDEYTDHS